MALGCSVGNSVGPFGFEGASVGVTALARPCLARRLANLGYRDQASDDLDICSDPTWIGRLDFCHCIIFPGYYQQSRPYGEGNVCAVGGDEP
jgi:hypothetical protein